MSQVTIEVPKDIMDLVGEAGKAIYIETLKEVALKRLSHSKRQLEDLKKEIASFERKYKASYEEFEAHFPDTVEGHDDWIEWTYLIKASEELGDKINKLSFLMGK